MKTPMVSAFSRAGLIGLALFVLGSSAARAEDGAEKPIPAGVLKKYDKDGDGKLNEEEKAAWQAAKEAEKKAMLDKYDTNKDGKLSDEERAALKADKEKAKKEKEKDKEKKKEKEKKSSSE